MLFDQHCEQHRFKGQEVRRVRHRRNVIARTAKKIVEGTLVFFAQAASKLGECVLLVQNELSGGRKSASHGSPESDLLR